jgi:hypothetical protein
MAKLSEITGGICARFDVFPESIQWQGVGKREFKPDGKTYVYLDEKVIVGEIDIFCFKCGISGVVYASLSDSSKGKKYNKKERVHPCK